MMRVLARQHRLGFEAAEISREISTLETRPELVPLCKPSQNTIPTRGTENAQDCDNCNYEFREERPWEFLNSMSVKNLVFTRP